MLLAKLGRATPQLQLVRATLAVQATLAQRATGQLVRARAMVVQTTTDQAKARVRVTAAQTPDTAVLMPTEEDPRPTSQDMTRTLLWLEVIWGSMALDPLAQTEEALRLISHLVLWVRVPTASRLQSVGVACCSVKHRLIMLKPSMRLLPEDTTVQLYSQVLVV